MSAYPSPVPGAKVTAFLREFPKLKPYITYRSHYLAEMPVVRLKVERIDKELGQRRRRSVLVNNTHVAPVGGLGEVIGPITEHDYEELNILNRDWELLMRVGQSTYTPPRKWWMWWTPEPRFRMDCAETLESALQRLGEKAGEAYYVLSIEPVAMQAQGRNVWGNEVGVNRLAVGKAVTIYKPPKDFSLVEWLEECVEREREALQGDLQQIDVV